MGRAGGQGSNSNVDAAKSHVATTLHSHVDKISQSDKIRLRIAHVSVASVMPVRASLSHFLFLGVVLTVLG